MPARKKGYARILPPPTAEDPYPVKRHGRGFRYVIVGADGYAKPSEVFPSKARAVKERIEAQRTIDGAVDVGVREALEHYCTYLVQEEGWEVKSVDDTRWRIEKMVPLDVMLEEITPKGCACLYSYLKWPLRLTKFGRPMATDSHRNVLMQVRMFFAWCVKREYMKESPAALVEGTGRRSKKGKPRMRIDEARLFEAVAHRVAQGGEEGGVAALAVLYCGYRTKTVVEMEVRDIDDAYTKIVIDRAKTPASERSRALPVELEPYFREMAKGKGRSALLWASKHDGDWVTDWVVRICELAGVPRVTAHGLRGVSERWAYESGGEREARERARQHAGHVSFENQSRGVYVDEEAVSHSIQRRALAVLRGGRLSDSGAPPDPPGSQTIDKPDPIFPIRVSRKP